MALTEADVLYSVSCMDTYTTPWWSDSGYSAQTFTYWLGAARQCQQGINATSGITPATKVKAQAAIDKITVYLMEWSMKPGPNGAMAKIELAILRDCLATPTWVAVPNTKSPQCYRLPEADPLGLLPDAPGLVPNMHGPAAYAAKANWGSGSIFTYYGSLEHPLH